MKWLRAAFRPHATASTTSPLAAALKDWGAEDGDTDAVARLEARLASVLAISSAAPGPVSSEARTPNWLVGLSAVTGVTVLALALHHATLRELETDAALHAQHTPATASSGNISKLEIASRLGVGPRELARQAAFDQMQR